MSFTDPIADMITRIRNGQLRKLNTVSIPNSRLRAKILDVLKDEGYISNYKILSEKQKEENQKIMKENFFHLLAQGNFLLIFEEFFLFFLHFEKSK